jgi:hypothetical protein
MNFISTMLVDFKALIYFTLDSFILYVRQVLTNETSIIIISCPPCRPCTLNSLANYTVATVEHSFQQFKSDSIPLRVKFNSPRPLMNISYKLLSVVFKMFPAYGIPAGILSLTCDKINQIQKRRLHILLSGGSRVVVNSAIATETTGSIKFAFTSYIKVLYDVLHIVYVQATSVTL